MEDFLSFSCLNQPYAFQACSALPVAIIFTFNLVYDILLKDSEKPIFQAGNFYRKTLVALLKHAVGSSRIQLLLEGFVIINVTFLYNGLCSSTTVRPERACISILNVLAFIFREE